MPESNEYDWCIGQDADPPDYDQYVGMTNELYMEHIEGPRIQKEKEQQEFRDHIDKMRETMENVNPGTNFPEGYFQPVDHTDRFLESIDNLSKEDLDMIYEQEHLQFLIDHHFFYWKMDRFMLSVDQRPLPAQIAQDRYLAHGARQNLLELWKKKELELNRNLSKKDA